MSKDELELELRLATDEFVTLQRSGASEDHLRPIRNHIWRVRGQIATFGRPDRRFALPLRAYRAPQG